MLNSYAARRALTFLTQRPEVDTTKLGVTGHSMGGITTTITGTDSRVKAIAPSVGGTGWDYELYWGTQQANKFLYLSMNPQFQEWGMIPTAQELSDYDYYVRTVSQESYWPSINAPALFIGATNDFNSPFDRIQPSIDLMPAGIESNVSISTHYNHGFIDSTEITQALWLDTHLKGSFDYPTQGDASLDLTRASGIPVYSVTPDQSVASAVSKVDIYYGYERMPLERFWHEATAFEVSPGTWEAPCPVFDTNDPLFAYAAITYDLGYEKNFTFGKTSSSFNVASSTKIAYPEDLTANDIVADNSHSRLIDKGDDGHHDWYKQYNYFGSPFIYGTYKFGSPKHQGPNGASLSIDVTTDSPNNWLVVTFMETWWDNTSKGLNDAYQAIVHVPNAGLNTITIAPNQVLNKGTGAILANWSLIKHIDIKPASLVNAGYPVWSGSNAEISNMHWNAGYYATGNTNEAPVFDAEVYDTGNASTSSVYNNSIANTATDPEGLAITYSLISGPSWLSIANDGTLSGTPSSQNTGTNKWIVAPKDPYGATTFASIEMNVSQGSSNPTIKVILLGGQSNAVGQSASTGLPTSPINLQLPQDDIQFYYENLNAPSALTTLRPGSGGKILRQDFTSDQK